MALQPFVGPRSVLQIRNIFYTDGRTPWMSDKPVARPLPTHRTTQTQTSMPGVGFEPATTAFERAKTVHALDSAAYFPGVKQKGREADHFTPSGVEVKNGGPTPPLPIRHGA
jgi:hypothetical protein